MDYKKLPKIELHCHLDGSVKPETIISIASEEGIDLPSTDLKTIREKVIAPWECNNLNEYLERFTLPISVMQSRKALKRVAYELMQDAANENVKYIEIRFAPVFHMKKGLSLEEVIESVLSGINVAEKEFDIKGNLILSCLRNMPTEMVYDVVEAGRKYIGKGVVAVDLCGPEEEGFVKKFVDPITLARTYGYRVTIHAGETGIGKNVFQAVEMLNAERIGHGVFINNCREAYDIVKKKSIFLEMCPTSNIQTKAVNSMKEHPFYDFYKDGIKVTINTDNRTVSNTNMSNECKLIGEEFHISLGDYSKIFCDSVEAAFADRETKDKLREIIKQSLKIFDFV